MLAHAGRVELTLGRLGDAESTLHRALDLAEHHHAEHSPGANPGQNLNPNAGSIVGAGTEPPNAEPVDAGTADMLVALSRVAWHRNDLSRAAEYLKRRRPGEGAGLPQHPYRWRVAMARSAAEHDWSTALNLLDEARRVYVGDFAPPVHPIHATRARVLTASRDLAGAAAWAMSTLPASTSSPTSTSTST